VTVTINTTKILGVQYCYSSSTTYYGSTISSYVYNTCCLANYLQTSILGYLHVVYIHYITE